MLTEGERVEIESAENQEASQLRPRLPRTVPPDHRADAESEQTLLYLAPRHISPSRQTVRL